MVCAASRDGGGRMVRGVCSQPHCLVLKWLSVHWPRALGGGSPSGLLSLSENRRAVTTLLLCGKRRTEWDDGRRRSYLLLF